MIKIASIAIAIIFLFVIGFCVFDLTCRMRFMEDFSQAQCYQTKAEFVKQFHEPVYELTELSDIKHYGPIKDEQFLENKTLCMFSYRFPAVFIFVYFDNDTSTKSYITWEHM